MFETSIVRERVIGAERRVGLITASVAFHSLVAIALIATGLANVDLPKRAPNQSETFNPIPVVSMPEPQGNPRPAAAQPAARAVAVRPMPPQPLPDSAPQTVPDSVPQLAAPQWAATDTGGDPNARSDHAGRVGVPWGDPNAVDIGQTGAERAAPDAAGPLVIGGEVKAPVAIHRVDPIYPPTMERARVPGLVRLLCIIDKEGNVRSPQVVSSTFSAFDQSALEAVQKWRFVPGSLRGRAVDTYFELTVRFTVR